MSTSAVAIASVTVEHYCSALGIHQTSPRISWRFDGTEKEWIQTSYDIQIERPCNVAETYRIDSSESVLVPWPSAPLRARESVTVSVKAHGRHGSTEWRSLNLEAGLSAPDDWTAVPITGEQQEVGAAKRPFRVLKTFQVERLQAARLYVTGLGVYEVTINGKRVGDEVLAPGWTQYESQLVYRTHDVTGLLKEGENWIGAYVGEGWYAGRLGFGGGKRDIWGSRPAFIAQLEVDKRIVAATDESWAWKYGGILESSIYDGEIYDTSVDESWQLDSTWTAVDTLPLPILPVASQSPPVREVEHIRGIEKIVTPSGKIVIDFGQNAAGYIEIEGEPPKGRIELNHFEVLEHGEVNMRPLRTARCQTVVDHSGEWRGYKPKFTFQGFRYVHVVGWDDVRPEDLVYHLISTDMQRIGEFRCSHALLNRLHQNVVYSTVANCISLPTDCPQRDERLGWTGDVQVFAPTLNFLFDGTGMLDGWLRDLAYEQSKAGGIVPIVTPSVDDHFKLPSAVWGDVIALLPAVLHQCSGDLRILSDFYPSMKEWLEKGVKRDPSTGLWDPNDMQFGDWLAPQVEGSNGTTDPHLVSDAYLVHVTRTVARIARLLGNLDDAEHYSRQAEKLLGLFQDTYITARHRTVSDTVTALALILHFDLVHPAHPEQRIEMVTRLEKLVKKCLWQVSTGFAGTPIILHVLAENNMLHHAYRMLQAKDSPSWLAPVLLGATTIWERWDSMRQDGSINPDEMVSFNHYALGEVASFFHAVVGGISAIEPGWRKILVKPRPGGTISSATVSHLSPYGLVSCDWRVEGGLFKAEVRVPPNCTAKVELPGTTVADVGSGVYHFEEPFVADERFPPTISRPHFLPPITNTFVP